MAIESSMPQAPAATYVHETMSRKNFRRWLASLPGAQKLTLRAPYHYVEYLNAPAGLIVLAHHNDSAGQVDGIHPVSLTKSISNSRNIIEPLKRNDDAPAYNVHYMTRRSQGSLVHYAFGRMINPGDPEALALATYERFSLEIISASFGPVIGVIDNKADKVHVILPAVVALEAKEAA